MNDCPNAEMRDRLPDLLHDRLTATVRAEVTAHVDVCVDCREELILLRGVHSLLVARTPRVDVTYIVNALPKPAARPAVKVAPRRTWADWRIAAAITMIAVGGTSVAVARRGEQPVTTTAVVAPSIQDTAPGGRSIDTTPPVVAEASPSTTDASSLGMSGQLADLDESQLQSLLQEIEQMKAVPMAEPEPISIKVDPKASTLPEEGL